MSIRVISFWFVGLMSLTMFVSAMRFHIELMFILKAIKPRFKGSYDKKNFTFVVVSYKINKIRRRLVL